MKLLELAEKLESGEDVSRIIDDNRELLARVLRHVWTVDEEAAEQSRAASWYSVEMSLAMERADKLEKALDEAMNEISRLRRDSGE